MIESGSEGGVERCEWTVSGASVPAKEPHRCSTTHSVGVVVKVQSDPFECLPNQLIPCYERGVIAAAKLDDERGGLCLLLRIQCFQQAEYMIKRRRLRS